MKHKHRSKRRRQAVLVTGGTVTVATLGLSTCDNGTAVDPPPPPPLVCSGADQGQNLHATGALVDSFLTVNIVSSESYPGVDTVHVDNVAGATLDTLKVKSSSFELNFTLDSAATTQVTFTLAGTLDLEAGPCDFSRNFTVTINGGTVTVAQAVRELPLVPGRDVRIELVEREGRRVHLRPSGVGSEVAVWSVTGGVMESTENGGIVWELPPEAGFYQVDLYVDRGDDGFGFDALSLQVV